MSLKNVTQNKPNAHCLSQRKRRALMHMEGYKRLEINIPPELWRRLEPKLKPYGGKHYPGLAVVKLLGNIRFSGDKK